MNNKKILLGLILVVAVIYAVFVSGYMAQNQTPRMPAPEFSLTNHLGKAVTQADYADKAKMVFFGFSHCPDICPTTLGIITNIIDSLGANADKIYPIFITVDPEADTPEVMAQYVERFHKKLIGLTGTRAQIDAVTAAYGVYIRKVTNGETYSVDHSTAVFLIDKTGNFIDTLDTNDSLAKNIKRLTEFLNIGL